MGWLSVLLIALAATWWVTRRIPKAWARHYARLLVLPTLGYCWVRIDEAKAQLPDIPAVDRFALTEGGWRYILCGALEWRWSVGDVPLLRFPWGDPSEYHDSRAFRAWYASSIGGNHEHDWSRIGCQWGAGFVSCYMDPGLTYYQAIPRLPNPSLAVAMVRKVIASAPSDRLTLIRGLADVPPFQSIAAGEEMDREEFDQGYADWLAANPEWK